MSEESATAQYWTPKRVQQAVGRWRKPKQGKSICEGFCKHFGKNECPKAGKLPAEGHCPNFSISAKDIVEAQDLLAKDAKRSGVDLNKIHPGL